MTADIVELFVLRPVDEEKHGDARSDSEERSDSDENREALALVSERSVVLYKERNNNLRVSILHSIAINDVCCDDNFSCCL